MKSNYPQENWAARPWFFAIIGIITELLIRFIYFSDIHQNEILFFINKPTIFFSVSFFASLTILLFFTLERTRWQWSAIFSVVCAIIFGIIFVFYKTSSKFEDDGYRIICGILTITFATPLLQTARDQGAPRFSYAAVHTHACNDAVLWIIGSAFVSLVFALIFLLAKLFVLIKIHILRDLLEDAWLIYPLAFASLGIAIGMLRERGRTLRALHSMTTLVLAVLTPIIGLGFVVFLASLPFTGLAALWETKAATPTLLTCILSAIVLVSAVIGGEPNESRSSLLRYGALALVAALPPLTILAAISTGLRVEQYGLTPNRLWAVVSVIFALSFGLAYFAALVWGRRRWAEHVRSANLLLFFALATLALFLALPILDFKAISAHSQVARLESGKTAPDQFDWEALRFEYGKTGRKALDRLTQSTDAAIREPAILAQNSKSKGLFQKEQIALKQRELHSRIKIMPRSVPLPENLLEFFTYARDLGSPESLFLFYRPGDKSAILVYTRCPQCKAQVEISYLGAKGHWLSHPDSESEPKEEADAATDSAALARGDIAIRDVTRRQVFIDGNPVGDTFQ